MLNMHHDTFHISKTMSCVRSDPGVKCEKRTVDEDIFFTFERIK